MPAEHSTSHDIACALQAWQETADEAWLEHVLAETLPRLEDTARSVLRRRHVGDWSAIDDVLSLVLDHLRRLPATTPDERGVARFEPRCGASPGAGDPGLAYLVWLTRERAHDVARQRRRQATRTRRFAATGPTHRIDCTDWNTHADAADNEIQSAARLHAALAMLEPRRRMVIQLLLDGKSQAVIAHMLGVCEGTVSRLRARAISELKRLLT